MNPVYSMGNLSIRPAGTEDLSRILPMYDAAITFQRMKGYIGWDRIDEAFIARDAREGLLYKVCQDAAITAAFCVCYADPRIWRERERGDALYLHRVVVNNDYRGGRWFEKILAWAEQQARSMNRNYIRMDTWAENEKLIAYYESHGFRKLGSLTTGDDPSLPLQHRNLHVALLEREL